MPCGTRRRSEASKLVAPQPLKLGRSAFKGELHRWVWDLRDGKPVPLYTTYRAGNCAINDVFMESLFAECADKELVGITRYGVRTKADLDPQIVICPSLFSLYSIDGGVDAVVDEIRKLTDRGWYQFSDFIPFAPYGIGYRGKLAHHCEATPPEGWDTILRPSRPITDTYSRHASVTR